MDGPGGRGPAAGHPPGGALPLHRVQGCYAGAPAAYRRRGAVSPVPASGGGRHPVYDRLPGGGGGGWSSSRRWLAKSTIAIGHSGADYETSIRAIDAGAACLHPHFQRHGAVPSAPARHYGGRAGAPDLLRGHLRRTAPPPWHRADAPGLQGLGQGGCHHRLHPGRRPARRSLQAGGQRRGGGGRRRQAGQQRRAGRLHPHHRPRP